MNITNFATASTAVLPAGSGNQTLGQEDFLRLMTAQLQAQDPFKPLDNTQMVAQMAQFSSLAGISEVNQSLKAIADQLSTQTALLSDLKPALTTATVAAAN
jgi:flagellar basal-body rod modification protein FlgD